MGLVALDISHGIDNDSGVYMVKATNSKGSATTSGSLRVISKFIWFPWYLKIEKKSPENFVAYFNVEIGKIVKNQVWIFFNPETINLDFRDFLLKTDLEKLNKKYCIVTWNEI